MATGYPKTLNKWQQERSPAIASDAAIENVVDRMMQTDTVPMGQKSRGEYGAGLVKLTQKHFENDEFSQDIHFDVAAQEYKFKRLYHDGRKIIANGSLEDIDATIQFQTAVIEREAYEAANPVEVSEKERAVTEWMETFKFGANAKYYLDILPEDRAREFVRVVWTFFDRMFGKAAYTPEGINAAYVEAWDSGELDEYMFEADELAKQSASAPSVPVAAKPTRDLASELAERQAADKRNRELAAGSANSTAIVTPQGLRKLKRLAVDSRYALEHRK
jgi:hypothetical protein